MVPLWVASPSKVARSEGDRIREGASYYGDYKPEIPVAPEQRAIRIVEETPSLYWLEPNLNFGPVFDHRLA